jgi:uncharacterized protein (DUF2164 family)
MPLITTISEIKNYLAIDQNTEIDSLQPFINEAEILFIKPLLGTAFYDELVADYDPVLANMTANNQLIMPFVQRSLAYYMAYLSINQMGVNFGDMGIQQQFGDNSQPAPQWKVDKLMLSYIQQADVHAEKLLEYLEANANDTDTYASWYTSTANTKNEGYMVNNTRIASLYIDINDSRRIFLRLKKRIKDIESNYIKRLICADQYNALVTQIKADSISAENEALIEKLRPIIAKMALYYTIPSLRISITDQGIMIYSSSDGIISKQAADKDQIKHLLDSLKSEPFGFEADQREADEFIKDNIADYPLIAASDCYTIEVDPGPSWQVENSADNKHFSV